MTSRPFTVRLFNIVEPVNTFYRDLIPYWEAQGWQVKVIISRAQYRLGRQTDWMGKNTKVYWTANLGQAMDSRFGKLIIMIAYVLSAVTNTLLGQSVDRNLFLTQPPLFYLWGYILKLVRNQSYFIVLMDIYPDIAIQAGLLKENSLLARFLSRLARFGLQRADGIVVIGRYMRERVLNMGVCPERIHLIQNWADEETIHPIPHINNTFRIAQGWLDKFVVLYSGNMGTAHYFEDLLELCRRLRSDPNIVFAFIGKGQRLKEIENFKKKYSLGNVVLMPFQPENELVQSLGSGNIHFVSLRPEYSGLIVPSKFYGILAAGLPTVFQGSVQGEIAYVLKEYHVGKNVAHGDVEGLQTAILAYRNDPDMCRFQGQEARSLAETTYRRQTALHKYGSLLCDGSWLLG
jgi:colanic acid biosynthesis glycosyl transferase WcaI